MTTKRIAVIPGDGIGKEVTEIGIDVIKTVARSIPSLDFEFEYYPYGCEYYVKTGKMMDDDGLEKLARHDAILMGAVGYPTVPDHVSLWGLLIPIRRTFDQYVNLRPAKILNGIESPLKGKGPESFDFVVVRENTEGEYSNSGGRFKEGTADEVVIQNSIFTRLGVERVIRYAFEAAVQRSELSGKEPYVVGATKSNGIIYTMPFWDEVFRTVSKDYPKVRTDLYHVDALSAYLVTRPESFDVIVASNLFGDILTDLAAAISGGIGIAPSANINPEGKYPPLFEPVHGSAPDIAGKGIANPVGMIWTVSMLFDHLGFKEEGTRILRALNEVIASGIKTPDLGGKSNTSEVGKAVRERMIQLADTR